ncbi:MAG: hypothetical protein WD738_00830 [Pirellulales bacterium]
MCSKCIHSWPAIYTLVAVAGGLFGGPVRGAPPHNITVDGLFADWNAVPSYLDPVDDETQDWHGDPPAPLANHPDVDVLEYKFTHDKHNLYAYFRAQGQVGRTQRAADGNGPAGRFYVIVTIDVDNNNTTGYDLSDGGYYPSSNGYDMNMEIEYYDGAFNTGHYINHGAPSDSDEDLAPLIAQQNQGIVDVLPGSYDGYTQWVMFGDSTSGVQDLNDGTSITYVSDKGPVVQGIIEAAISPDGHELEMVAPFVGFMSYPGAQPGQRGDPIMALGRTIDISFSLESSPELFDNGEWASDTAAPIVGYFLGVPEPSSLMLGIAMFGWIVLGCQRRFRCRDAGLFDIKF